MPTRRLSEPVVMLFSAFAMLAVVALVSACEQPAEDGACVPRCEGLCNSDDGCGGRCDCPSGQLCNGSGFCMWEADCTQTCLSAGTQCGEVCGEFCGDCGPLASCAAGQCRCEPRCDGSRCGDDGCGGSCACETGDLCDARGTCVSAAACTDTCASRACGTVCGEPCGECDAGDACDAGGQCRCVPDCDGTHCGDDGCGDTCPSPCGSDPVALSCDGCALRLVVLESSVEAGQRRVTLGLDYAPLEQEPRARIADLRIRANVPVTLLSAEMGAALLAGEKTLWVDPDTGNPWRRLDVVTHQLLVLSTEQSLRMDTGRVATLRFWLQGAGPAAFSLVKRDETFAPTEADLALQATNYDGSVVVTSIEGGP